MALTASSFIFFLAVGSGLSSPNHRPLLLYYGGCSTFAITGYDGVAFSVVRKQAKFVGRVQHAQNGAGGAFCAAAGAVSCAVGYVVSVAV